MGRETAEALQAMIRSASDSMSGAWATVIGLVAILLATTGVFGEVQSSLNAVWKAQSRRSTLSRLVRARIASLGLVIAFGFVLMVSLAVSAALTALMTFLHGIFPVLEAGLVVVDFVLSIVLISALFAAMYKVLPDTPIAWHDVIVGAVCATLLFAGGKYLIALYIGQKRHRLELRRGRRADRAAALDLLFGADLPVGRGVHPRLGLRVRQPLRGRRTLSSGVAGRSLLV